MKDRLPALGDRARILPRYTDSDIATDPLEIMFAQREAREKAAQDAVEKGRTPLADPVDLRGIPCVALGVGGTSPGTNPATAVLRLDNVRPV
jgi:hypothetical protein